MCIGVRRPILTGFLLSRSTKTPASMPLIPLLGTYTVAGAVVVAVAGEREGTKGADLIKGAMMSMLHAKDSLG